VRETATGDGAGTGSVVQSNVGGRTGGHVEWLRGRTPGAPPALIRCIEALFAAHPEWEALARADALVEASELLLRRVLVGNASARASALDLLAADACVTYAFEAAADEPDSITTRALSAKQRIAAIAGEFNGASPGAPHPSPV
jgi:hypothetical protein